MLFRCIKWLFIGVAIAALVVLACWILLPDETLNPDAQRVIDAKPVVPPEQNAYYALWGLKASPELDAFEVGRQIVAAQAAMALQPDGYEAEFNPDAYLGVKPLVSPQLRLNTQLFCKRASETPNCLAALREHRDLIEAELRDLDSYVNRYRSARNYPHFEDVMMPTANMPFLPWPAVNQMSELVDAKIALDMVEPTKQEAALNELLAEILFWQKVGDETNILATRVTSAKLVQKKHRIASELIATYPQIAFDYNELLAKITMPSPPKSTNFGRTLDGEFLRYVCMMQNLKETHDASGKGSKDDPIRIASRFISLSPFRLNATNNLYYEHMRAVSNAYSKNGTEITASATTFESDINANTMLDPRRWFYNPIGHYLAGLDLMAYKKYAYRLHDLAGYSRLVELQRQLALNRTPPEKMAEFIATTDTNLSDPYSGKPMSYDPITQTISFTPRGTSTLSNSGEGSVSLKAAEGKVTAKP